MMQEIKQNQFTTLLYTTEPDGIIMQGVRSRESSIEIPAFIEGKPVTGIYKKAFFNCRSLRRLFLPDTLTQIGDWAFAHCPKLEYVRLPQKGMILGKSLFLGSEKLQEIELMPPEKGAHLAESDCEGGALTFDAGFEVCQGSENAAFACGRKQIAALLAAAVARLDANYLFSIGEAGSGEWLEKWDARLLFFLNRSDSAGFTRQVLCGEEDYGSTDQALYESMRRKEKVRLAFLRLLNPCGLSGRMRNVLEDYLRAYTKGCPHEETWEVVRTEHGEERAYYELFAGLGCITADNLDGMLEDLGQEHPEMKAYFMRYQEEKLGHEDFFAGLSLEL